MTLPQGNVDQKFLDEECEYDEGLDCYHYLSDEHFGELWLTQDFVDQYPDLVSFEELDWEENLYASGMKEEAKEKAKAEGWKWTYYVGQVEGVFNAKGERIRDAYQDVDVFSYNDLTQEMLDHPGCKIMGWCDG